MELGLLGQGQKEKDEQIQIKGAWMSDHLDVEIDVTCVTLMVGVASGLFCLKKKKKKSWEEQIFDGSYCVQHGFYLIALRAFLLRI